MHPRTPLAGALRSPRSFGAGPMPRTGRRTADAFQDASRVHFRQERRAGVSRLSLPALGAGPGNRARHSPVSASRLEGSPVPYVLGFKAAKDRKHVLLEEASHIAKPCA